MIKISRKYVFVVTRKALLLNATGLFPTLQSYSFLFSRTHIGYAAINQDLSAEHK
jgi:hypothetical protein